MFVKLRNEHANIPVGGGKMCDVKLQVEGGFLHESHSLCLCVYVCSPFSKADNELSTYTKAGRVAP